MNEFNDLDYIYEKLKDKYNLILTNTKSLDERFTIDTKVITGTTEKGTFMLYDDIFSIDYSDKTSTHFHTVDLDDAINSIKEFMEEK